MAKPVTLDPKNTSTKEAIRRNIRHALSSKSPNKFPNIDLASELFENIEDPVKTFIVQFRAAGGKYVPCTMENFFPMLLQLIEDQKYHTILAVDHSLNEILKANGKSSGKNLFSDTPADAGIFHTDTLIARSGSICLSQKNLLYPSIKNLAKDIILVARPHNIVNDLKDALTIQAELNEHLLPNFVEVIKPVKPFIIDGKESYSPVNPRFILFLVS